MKGTELELMFRIRGSRYTLPEYQRGYSWEPEHVNQFLQDLESANNGDENYQHFFGYILTARDKHSSERLEKIIDGQQRMTTATLFLICARNFFYTYRDKSSLAKRYCENLEERIFTSVNKIKLDINQPILKLSRTNNQLFIDLSKQTSIKKIPPTNFRKKHDSNVLLHKAYKIIQEWFMTKIRSYKSEAGDEQKIDTLVTEINEYVITLFGKFIIDKSYYEDQDEAYEIFSLVNSRGINLADSDLIKSYLFGEFLHTPQSNENDDPSINEDAIEHYDERWNEMRSNVMSKDKAGYKDLDTFLCHYLIAFNTDKLPSKTNDEEKTGTLKLSQKQMCDVFKRLVRDDKKRPSEIIDELHTWSTILTKLRNPSDVSEFKQYDELIHYLKKIKDVKAVFVYPIILAGYQKYWEDEKPNQFQALVMMCFKYHVRAKIIGGVPSVSRYEQIAYKITNFIRKDSRLESIIKYLINDPRYYPSDDDVLRRLEQLRLRNRGHIIALLEEVEYTENKKRSCGDVTVEHIMPKKFEAWEEYIIEQNNIKFPDPKNEKKEAKKLHEDSFDFLGNLTLLSGKSNDAAATKSFTNKKKVYQKDETYAITEQLVKEKEWTIKRINERQKKFAGTLLHEINLKRIHDALIDNNSEA